MSGVPASDGSTRLSENHLSKVGQRWHLENPQNLYVRKEDDE